MPRLAQDRRLRSCEHIRAALHVKVTVITCAGGEEFKYEYNLHVEGPVGHAEEWEFTIAEGSQGHGGFFAACLRFHVQIPEYIF